MANPTFNAGAYDFNQDASTSRTLALTTVSGANYLHVMIGAQSTPSGVAFNGDSMTLEATRTTASSYEIYHYKLANPDIGSYNLAYTVAGSYDNAFVLAVAANDVDTSDPIRGYHEQYGTNGASPFTKTPAGNLAGDLMLMFAADLDTFSGSHAAASGSTQIGSTDTRGLGVYKSSTTTSDTLGVTFTSEFVGFLTGSVALKGVASAAPVLSSPTATATGPTQATIGVTSDTAPTTTAISYQILPAATAAPSAATIVGAPDGTISTGSAGALTKAITGLTTNTAVKVHFAQGASSNVVSSASFTPNTLAIAGTALSAQSGTQGSAFSWSGSTPDSLISNHGNGAGSWSGSGLSGSGLSVNSSTGVLSGTCGAPAVYSATLTYTDSSTVPAAQTVSKAVTVTITALGGGGVTFAGTVPPKTGSAGSAFDFGSPALDSYFTGAGTYAAQSGSLGSIGLSLDANTGVISGATPIAGTQSVVIRKTAASGSPATADTNSFQITIEAAAVSDSGTILLPPVGDLRDGQEITIFSSLAVTALTVSGNGASVNGAPLALAANGYFRLKFNASSLAWYRIG